MAGTEKPYRMITDYVTGTDVPLVGAEENRQRVETYLVETRGYTKEDIEVDVPLAFEVAGEPYRAAVDLVVSANGRRRMAFKCAAGSLGSREREIVYAARLVDAVPLPLAVVSDGRTAIVLDVLAGKTIGTSLDAIPGPDTLETEYADFTAEPIAPERLERERLIFRSYDLENVNVIRSR
jgi:hypothetical protein